MATPQQDQAARARLEESKARVSRMAADYHDLMQGRPTPTQAECDDIKMGIHLPTKSPSGAPAAVWPLASFGVRGAGGQQQAAARPAAQRQPNPRPQQG